MVACRRRKWRALVPRSSESNNAKMGRLHYSRMRSSTQCQRHQTGMGSDPELMPRTSLHVPYMCRRTLFKRPTTGTYKYSVVHCKTRPPSSATFASRPTPSNRISSAGAPTGTHYPEHATISPRARATESCRTAVPQNRKHHFHQTQADSQCEGFRRCRPSLHRSCTCRRAVCTSSPVDALDLRGWFRDMPRNCGSFAADNRSNVPRHQG